ncbi:MAG: hypothetical protein AAF518_26795 [Spirochaetota bacterium]
MKNFLICEKKLDQLLIAGRKKYMPEQKSSRFLSFIERLGTIGTLAFDFGLIDENHAIEKLEQALQKLKE